MKGNFWTKTGLVEVELRTDPKTGLLFRKGSSDMDMIKTTMTSEYNTVNCAGHTVLDLGANVGSFILKAAKDGAKSIRAWEPEPHNIVVLEQNAELLRKRFPETLIEVNAAGIGKDDGFFNLNIRPGSNSTCSASLVTKQRKNNVLIKVRVDSFTKVLDKYQPTLVKMDIEGAEYQCLEGLALPSYVREFIVELHGFSKRNNELMHKYYEEYASSWTVVNKSEKIAFMKIALITAHFKR